MPKAYTKPIIGPERMMKLRPGVEDRGTSLRLVGRELVHQEENQGNSGGRQAESIASALNRGYMENAASRSIELHAPSNDAVERSSPRKRFVIAFAVAAISGCSLCFGQNRRASRSVDRQLDYGISFVFDPGPKV